MTNEKPTTSQASNPVATTLMSKQFAGGELSPTLMRQVILSLQSNQRRGVSHTKTRGQVSGSTRKPWRQKGTGRARVGSKRTPLWRGGGIIFGPTSQRNWSKDINQKVLTPALLTALSKKAADKMVVEVTKTRDITKTKDVIGWLGQILDPKSNLLIVGESDPNLMRAVKNIKYITVTTSRTLNPLEVMKERKIIFLPGALEIFSNRVTK